MAISSENCDVALETFAEWFAYHVHFAPRSGEALARLGIAAADFERARTHWEGTLQADMIVAERDERILLFGQCFTAVRKRLRAEKRTIESLGPLPALPAALDAASAPVANVVPGPAAAPQPAPAKATYQLDEPRAAPTPAEPPRPVASSFDPDETLPIPAPFVAKPAVPFAGETRPELGDRHGAGPAARRSRQPVRRVGAARPQQRPRLRWLCQRGRTVGRSVEAWPAQGSTGSADLARHWLAGTVVRASSGQHSAESDRDGRVLATATAP